ncbi:triose-phosphate isomerase [bacterium]|nr:triose-phosphate isomerase [bacterium]
MKKFIVAANWKMNKTPKETSEFLKEFKTNFKPISDREILFFPSFLSLPTFHQELTGNSIHFGAQNCHWQASGAFTGEVSIPMLQDLGCTVCLVGHSERRTLFSESNQDVALKTKALQAAGLTPVVCIGETEAQRNQGQTLSVVTEQMAAVVSQMDVSKPMIVAYEPVWAIGTGKVPTLAEITEVHQFLRKYLVEKIGSSGSSVPLLYGGSVNSQNARDIESVSEVNGFLIGGASLKVASLLDIYFK